MTKKIPVNKTQDNHIAEYQDALLRCRAEFDNYMKRVEKEKHYVIQSANAQLITKLLPVLDNFNRAIEHFKKDGGSNQTWLSGISAIEKQFKDILAGEGLQKIDCERGGDFDPTIHEAILSEKSDLAENKIIEEVETGYSLNGKILRVAKVKVSSSSK